MSIFYFTMKALDWSSIFNKIDLVLLIIFYYNSLDVDC